MCIITLILIFLIMIFLNINRPIQKNISALSYLTVKFDVPHNELLKLFITKYSDDKYMKYFDKILSINKLPVYVIKKIGDKYEYEVYFYRYNPNRKSSFKVKNAAYLDIKLDEYKKFPTRENFDFLGIKPYNNELFNKNNFIICSYDINESFFKNRNPTFNYYFDNDKDRYHFRYITIEEEPSGKIQETNKYGLFNHIFKNQSDRSKFLIDKFETDECIVFYAYKPKTNSESLYYENLNYDKFIYFLEYFKYDNEIIDFCQKTYNNNNRFCISYDIAKDKSILKTAIFSILN